MANRSMMTVSSVLLAAALMFQPLSALADGEVGDHVNDLKAHLSDYESEVTRFTDRVDRMVETYASDGAGAVETDALIDLWEEVRFHSAIEVNYVPVYAKIWQGIYGVKEAIDNEQDVATVRSAQQSLNAALWQGLGAVRLAAKNQAAGKASGGGDQAQNSPTSGAGTIDQIMTNLDQVTVEHAEEATDEATELVHDTYMNLFEGIEGTLIEQDAELVEALEKDFNVTLPQLLENGASVSKVTEQVDAMKDKLARARKLLKKAEENQGDVF